MRKTAIEHRRNIGTTAQGQTGLAASGFERKAKSAGSPRREPAAPLRAPVPLRPPDGVEHARIGWHEAIATTVAGLGYELVDVERAQRGLLRITIDRIPGRSYTVGRGPDAQPDASEFVTVEDCEAVTRQLQYVLEVEGLDYARLEVSSPGLDRPLKREADYARFVGHAVRINLKAPFEGRKVWEGQLSLGDGEGWTLAIAAKAEPKHGKKNGDSNNTTGQVLGFTLHEVREARLVPEVDFKGRKAGVTPGGDADKVAAIAAPAVDGGL